MNIGSVSRKQEDIFDGCLSAPVWAFPSTPEQRKKRARAVERPSRASRSVQRKVGCAKPCGWRAASDVISGGENQRVNRGDEGKAGERPGAFPRRDGHTAPQCGAVSGDRG